MEPGAAAMTGEVLLLCQGQSVIGQQLRRVLGDGRCGGETGGADARQVQKVGGGQLNDEVPTVCGGTHPGKVADGLPEVHRGHRLLGGLPHKGQPVGGGGHVVPLHRGGVGPYDQVAVDGGGHQDALAVGAGALEDHVAHPVSLALVQQEVLAPGGVDGKGGGRGHLMDGLGPDAGGVDHVPAVEVALVGVDQPALFRGLQPGNGGVQVELCAVDYGSLRQGQTVLPGGADGGGGSVEGRGHPVGQVGVHGSGLVPGEQLELRHAVGLSPLEQGVEGSVILRREGQDQGAAGAVGDIQFGAQLLGQLSAPHVEPGHQGTGLRVITGVEDGGVGLGGAVGHVVFPLQNSDLQLVAGELEGGCRAGDAAANDENVIHNRTS